MKKPSNWKRKKIRKKIKASYNPKATNNGAMALEREQVLVAGSIGEMLESYDASSLASAKANWYFGEWQELVKLDLEKLSNHPDVAKFAALKAAGHQQLDDTANCKKYVRVARNLGCDNRVIAQLLVAGVHNSLGKLAALKGDDKKTLQHFSAAVQIGDQRQDAKLARHARSVKEMAKLGLLPQAAKLIQDEAVKSSSLTIRSTESDARLTILASEVELINHELSLAHQKAQLYANAIQTESAYNSDSTINKEHLKQLSPSQLGQDLWVLERTNYKKNGYFVEFGATDGILLSNSYLLEKEFGWQGLCAEPNPKFYQQLINNRSCTVSDSCIADVTGKTIEFVLANEYGGILDYADSDVHEEKRAAYIKEGNVIGLTTISLHDFLISHKAPKEIDYLSIDTEGSELNILQAFPFDKWDIKCLTVEHNFTEQRETIKTLLESHGYQCVEAEWDDWYFIDNKDEV